MPRTYDHPDTGTGIAFHLTSVRLLQSRKSSTAADLRESQPAVGNKIEQHLRPPGSHIGEYVRNMVCLLRNMPSRYLGLGRAPRSTQHGAEDGNRRRWIGQEYRYIWKGHGQNGS